MVISKRQIWWVSANSLGIGAFLTFASRAWIEPELANEPGASAGDFIVWGVSALPILTIFLLAHLFVGAAILATRRRDWTWVFVLTAICWVAAAVFDNAHHGI